MNRFRASLLALAILLLAGLLWWMLQPTGSLADTAAADQPRKDLVPAVLRPDPALAGLDPVMPLERTEAAPVIEVPTAAQPDKTRLLFRGRCVAAETGAPLAGCTVNFYGWPGNDDLIAKYGEPDWKEPEPVVTGEDGTFAFDVPETLPYQFACNCHAPGRLGRSDRYDTEIPGGTLHDLGDVPLQRGAEITGIVRDELGAPVEQVRILFQNLPMEIRPGQGAGDSAGAISLDDGSFRLADALPAGTWPIRLDAKACTLVGPESCTIDPGMAPVFVEVRVRRSPSLEGMLVDEAGAPVPRVYVRIERHTSGRTEGDWTDEQGHFQIYRQRDSEEPVKLSVEDGMLESTEFEDAYAWGSTGIRLQVRRLPTIEIIVREKGGGAPVEDFALRCHGTGANSSQQTGLRLGGLHAGGRLTVDGVAYGENVLVVIPKDPALLPNTKLVFTAPREEQEPLVVELERLIPLRLRLLSRQGNPLAGSSAALLDQAVPEVLSMRSLDPRGTSSVSFYGSKPPPIQWSRGAAGEDGEVELHLPAGAPLAFLVVEGAHPRHAQEIDKPLEHAQPLVITLPLGASLRGQLIHPLAGSGRVGVLAVPAEPRPVRLEPWMPDKDGHFEGLGLLPGTYALHLIVQYDYADLGGGGHGGRIEMQPALAHVTLAAEETRDLVLDASAFAFGALRARAEIAEEVSGLNLDLILMRPPDPQRSDGLGRFGAFVADAGRAFHAESFPPGTYAAEARWKAADGTARRLRSRNQVELPPGASVAGTFEFVGRTLRLRVLDAGGQPLAGIRVQERPWTAEDAPFVVSDSDGWVEFGWVNAGRLEPRVLTDPPRFLAPVEVRADQDVTIVEARALTREESAAERAAAKDGG